MIRLFYFAGLRELTGVAEEKAALAGQTVEGLWQWAEAKYPGIRNGSVRVAVNEEYALANDILQDGDTVAFIPPVSGG
ncbi:molybdopterin converting factor subunit 1 [Planococcus lenghuensis]|uniref:Molybdopterin synthase sulfur carrier subunit n=1 Tax=Planococcus lenghuensis TaxID=2213202 RepID=A0A1Q2KUZ0_9BACL|nr:molybdopterin converting factor subunit 1 [Planococcus lenghuensis]AQQ51946.1 molybdopterin converting factor subunit 1 [Planococcus lenghuensis]